MPENRGELIWIDFFIPLHSIKKNVWAVQIALSDVLQRQFGCAMERLKLFRSGVSIVVNAFVYVRTMLKLSLIHISEQTIKQKNFIKSKDIAKDLREEDIRWIF